MMAYYIPTNVYFLENLGTKCSGTLVGSVNPKIPGGLHPAPLPQSSSLLQCRFGGVWQKFLSLVPNFVLTCGLGHATLSYAQ